MRKITGMWLALAVAMGSAAITAGGLIILPQRHGNPHQ